MTTPFYMNPSLLGKTILITGGTSRLGTAFVQKALAQKARVYFTFFQSEEAAQRLREAGAEGFRLDLRDMRQVDELARGFRQKVPCLDVLVHNGALTRDHTLQNMTEEEWDEVITADLKAPYYLTKKLLPLLFKGADGKVAKIFMIVSRVALTGCFGAANYAAAKAGVIALVKSLAQELGKKQILVNAVNPGFMKSRMTESLPEEVVQQNIGLSPLGRPSDPEEVADFLVYLASDQMTQVTGQVLHFESRRL